MLLFYALNQAGRAVLAAHGPRDAWDVHGPGVKVETQRERIGETEIKPDGDGLFQAVAAATGWPALTASVTLAEVWAGVPGLPRSPGLGDDLPPVLTFSESDQTVRSDQGSPFEFEEFGIDSRSIPAETRRCSNRTPSLRPATRTR
jgi:hypothetical protein